MMVEPSGRTVLAEVLQPCVTAARTRVDGRLAVGRVGREDILRWRGRRGRPVKDAWAAAAASGSRSVSEDMGSTAADVGASASADGTAGSSSLGGVVALDAGKTLSTSISMSAAQGGWSAWPITHD